MTSGNGVEESFFPVKLKIYKIQLIINVLFLLCAVIHSETRGGGIRSDTLSIIDSTGDSIKKPLPDLEPMRVSDRRYTSYNASVKTILASEFKDKYRDLSELLKTVSGVIVKQSGGVGQYTSTSIRGCSGNQVQVFLDGVPLNNAQNSTVDISKIPLNSLERVVVYKGTSPLELMGQNAGGVIELSTKTEKNIVAGNFKLGTFGYCGAGVLVAKKNGGMMHKLSVDFVNAENDFPYLHSGLPYNDADGVERKMDNSHFTMVNALYNNRYVLNSTNIFDLQLGYSFTSEGIFTYLPPDTNDGYIKIRQITFDGSHNRDIGSQFTIAIKLNGRYLKNNFQRMKPFHLGNEKKIETLNPYAQILVIPRFIINDNFSFKFLVAGVGEGVIEDNLWYVEPNPLHASYRVQARGGLEFEYNHREKIGARFKYLHKYVIDTTNGRYYHGDYIPEGSSSNSHNSSAEFEFRYQPLKQLALSTSLKYNNRNPSFSEKYSRGSKVYGAEIHGSSKLKNEKRLEFDIGASLNLPFLSTTLSYFQSRTDDKIIFLVRSQKLFVPENICRVNSRGVEWDFNIEIREHISIINSLTYMKNPMEFDEIPYLNGNDEPLIPRFKDRLEITLNLWEFQLGHSLNYSSSYYKGIHNVARMKTKPELGAFVSYFGIPLLTIRYSLDNYLGYTNYDFFEQPKPGRAHYFSVKLDL